MAIALRILQRVLRSTDSAHELPGRHSLSLYSPLSSVAPPEKLVSDVVSLLTYHRSKSRWSHLRALCPNGLTPAQFSQISIRLKSNPHLALRFFHFTRRHSLCDHDLSSYATMVHVLSRARLKSRAQDLIRESLRVSPDSKAVVRVFEVLARTYRECDSAPFVFDLLIKCCLEAKKVDGALEIVRLLMSRGLSPKVSTLNSLIWWVSRSRGALAGYEIYKEAFRLDTGGYVGDLKGVARVSPNVHTFNALMMCFYHDFAMDRVQEIWDEMTTLNIVPNVCSFSILIALYCKDGKIVEAEQVWDEMRGKGIEADVLAYNTMIGGFCESGLVERAEELVREMGLKGLENTCVTYEHLIEGYCQVGDFDSALLVYNDMRRRKFRPAVSTIYQVIEGLCLKSREHEALEIVRGAADNFAMLPKSYEVLIKGLCMEGRMEEALNLQAEMVGKGFEPNLEIYSAFLDGYINQGNKDMAEKLRKEMLDFQEKVK